MRTLRTLSAVLAVVALSACTAAEPGWTYAPAPSPTPIPSVLPSGSAPPASAPASAPASSSGSAPPASASPGAGTVLELEAENIAFNTAALTAPADQRFQIDFKNNDPGIPHNVEVKDASGSSPLKGDIITGVAETVYDVPALAAGQYTFLCTVHPTMTGTLTAG
jgi:plastocyanin